MNRKAILEKVADYMVSKGKMLSIAEYKAASDKPINHVLLKRAWGSWSRLTQLIKSNFPEKWEAMHKPVVQPKAAPKTQAKKEVKEK
tara:strand:- start:662 stop:922 length:261 start_codon:yes stop_codon:yes gene_type:complete